MLEGGGGAEGRREGGDWRRAAGSWPTGAGWGHGRACAARGAPRGSAADLRSKGVGSAAFRSDLLEIVFAHVQVSTHWVISVFFFANVIALHGSP